MFNNVYDQFDGPHNIYTTPPPPNTYKTEGGKSGGGGGGGGKKMDVGLVAFHQNAAAVSPYFACAG